MNRDEAIYELKNAAWLGTDHSRARTEEAVEMAIQALSQEPTFDDECQIDMDEAWEQIQKKRKRIPVTLDLTPCDDAISREDAINIASLHCLTIDESVKALERLPSVTQKSETGHWIDTDEWCETVDGFEQWGYFRKCSKCGYVFKFLEIDNYCPNCGAKMESEE